MNKSKLRTHKLNQLKQARLEIVATMYKRGFTIRKIRSEVMTRLDIATYSTRTVMNDIQTLLDEWREFRIANTDEAIQLELERIDDCVAELWMQWERSKKDRERMTSKKKGYKVHDQNVDKNTDANTIQTTQREESQITEGRLGDPAYMSEIRQQLAERRKLLGLYAAAKTEFTGKDGKDLYPVNEMSREEIMKEIERIKAIRNDK